MSKLRLNLTLLASMIVGLVCQSAVFGHFIWVAKSSNDAKVKIYFGEGTYPDQAQFLDGLKAMKVWAIEKSGQVERIKFEKKTDGDNGWFECIADRKLVRVDADCQYGIFSRGENNMFLHYCAKYCEFEPGMKIKTTGKLPIDIEVASKNQSTIFRVLHNNKPAVNCELQIVDDKQKTHDLKTDNDGITKINAVPENQWHVRAKIVDETSGMHNDQRFDQKRFYCTLVLGLPTTRAVQPNELSNNSSKEPFQSHLTASKPLPELPVGITSFGGAVVGDHVYVFGGHCGEAHNYYKSGQNNKLYRNSLKSPGKWDVIHEGTGLQGLAMVAYRGQLFRVGGFTARNEHGEDQDLHSVAEFARFNFDSKTWEQLEPMPVPRSSLDAVVIGDKLFVVGGWTMKGKDPKKWCDCAISIDLSDKNARWKSFEVPFKRRALSTGFQGSKLYAVGGMRQKGGPTSEVKVYDLERGTWSDGPSLPGSGGMEGFGSSCFNVGGKLIVSTYGGDVLKLNDDQDGWVKLHELKIGRFFHRLLPAASNKFMLVGGANMDVGKLVEIEVFEF